MLEARANPYSPPDNAKPPTARAIISQDWGVAPRAPQPVHGLSPPDEPGVLWLLSDPEIKVRRRENENVRDLAFSLSLSLSKGSPQQCSFSERPREEGWPLSFLPEIIEEK